LPPESARGYAAVDDGVVDSVNDAFETADLEPEEVLETVIPHDADPIWASRAILSMARDYVAANRTPTKRMWFTELFRSEYLKSMGQRTGVDVDVDVGFLENALDLSGKQRILDVGCGYGRHALPLTRKGYDVVGVDLSMDLLRHGLALAKAEGLTIKLVHGDMRDLNFKQVFNAALCMDTTFGYFTDHENLLILRSIFTSLKPGGRFVLDVANRDRAIQLMPQRNWWEGEGCLVQEDVEFSDRTSRLSVRRFLVFSNGTQREYGVSLRLFSAHELISMLELVGFEIVHVSGSMHTAGAFFGVLSERIIVTAIKP